MMALRILSAIFVTFPLAAALRPAEVSTEAALSHRVAAKDDPEQAEVRQEPPPFQNKKQLEAIEKRAAGDEHKKAKEFNSDVSNIGEDTVLAVVDAEDVVKDVETLVSADIKKVLLDLEEDPAELTLNTNILINKGIISTLQLIKPWWLRYIVGWLVWGAIAGTVYTVHHQRKTPDRGPATFMMALCCCPCGFLALFMPIDELTTPESPKKKKKPRPVEDEDEEEDEDDGAIAPPPIVGAPVGASSAPAGQSSSPR